MNNTAILMRRLIVGAVLIAVIATGVLAVYNLTGSSTDLVHIGGSTFHAEIVVKESDRERGLSGRDNLAENEAMLFVFPSDNKWGIWMKDMSIPLDIVWLDANKQIVDYRKNVDPDSYPTVYKPDKNARYVIELAAGTIKDKHITKGMSAQFDMSGEVE